MYIYIYIYIHMYIYIYKDAVWKHNPMESSIIIDQFHIPIYS